MQRHLSSLETRTDASSGPGLLSLVTTPTGLSEPGTFPVSDTFAAMLGTLIGFEIVKFHAVF